VETEARLSDIDFEANHREGIAVVRTSFSRSYISIGCRNSPAGNCGSPGFSPEMPANFSAYEYVFLVNLAASYRGKPSPCEREKPPCSFQRGPQPQRVQHGLPATGDETHVESQPESLAADPFLPIKNVMGFGG
jgi:hypothetical protein